ncbi:MAG: tetratricopeptide repeat protein [Chlorobi bacterium]|nr:tetratricopeptide repeat protein [Chlorobiota bacterium]
MNAFLFYERPEKHHVRGLFAFLLVNINYASRLMFQSLNTKSILIFCILFLMVFNINAQNQKFPLSRSDSADINIYKQKADEYKVNKYYREESDCYNKIATIWWEHNYFSQAAEYFNKSLEINKRLGNANGIAMINSNLALIYADNGDYEKALEYFDKTLSIRKSRKEKIGIIAARINMSVVLNNLKRYDESVKHLGEALDVAREINDYKQMRSCYGMLSETYEKAGNYKKSMYYFELYKKFNELVEEEKINKAYRYAKEQELKRELAEKENQIKELELIKKNYEIITTKKNLQKTEKEKISLLDTLSTKELKIKYLENEKKLNEARQKEIALKNKLIVRNTIYITLIILLLLFIVIFFYFQKRKSYKILSIKNDEISKKNEEIKIQKDNIEELLTATTLAHESIKESIDYAAYIQNAMINKTPKLSDYIPNSFILYKPKDIVGGDFYWYTKIDDKIVVAAVDCTGHGVPGAFLTVLGNNTLNGLVNVLGITKPGEILKRLHYEVSSSLNQENSDNRDGMDIALCTFDVKKKKFWFAGANNPLVLFQNNELKVVKGEKYGIAGFSNFIFERINEDNKNEVMYKTHEFDITEDTCLYLFSDGYRDQIGGKEKKKLKTKNFLRLLEENYQKPVDAQKKNLMEFFENWKGDEEQIDDVLIIGIKF